MKLNKKEITNIKNDLILWIRHMMGKTNGTKAILGISGGKDSSIVAALCKKALGNKNVIGVIMPDGIQEDISFAFGICEELNIKYIHIPINSITSEFLQVIENENGEIIKDISENTKINLPARVRMTLLYAISQSIPNSRVINTGNLSEKWIGYTTVYGDNTGAFSPLGNLTSDEVIQLGRILGLPEKYIIKPAADGLTGQTDEDVLGFSYESLNKYIREGIIPEKSIKEKLDNMHEKSKFKFETMPTFPVDLP
ncbi:MAG TPA: NAD(+) synthase [Tissierellaceae bacterium]|nr:NAD(+) synthase [Tissierellaceae bacterium]